MGFSTEAEHEITPTAVFDTKTEKVTSVAIGNNHLILLTTAGNVYTLGVGEEGQLGRRVVERRKIRGTLPEKIVLGNKRNRKAVAVGAGNNHSFAVDEDGVVWAWGINAKGQLGTGVGDLRVDGEVMTPKKVIGLSKEELGGDRREMWFLIRRNKLGLIRQDESSESEVTEEEAKDFLSGKLEA